MREGDHSSSWVRSDREQGLGSFSKSQGKGDTFIPTQEQLDGERIGGHLSDKDVGVEAMFLL